MNAAGTFLFCKHAGLIMTGQETGGSVVTLGDWADSRPYRNYPAYFVAKGSIPTMTRMLAIELGALNPRVRANCILPGPALVPDSVSREEQERIAEATLVKRLGKPDDIASAVLFLAENSFVTGTVLPIDGGRTIFAAGL